MRRKMHFHNLWHYGDCLFSLHFLIKICKCNDLECDLCCNPEYHPQLQEFIPNDSQIVLSNSKYENSIDLWVGSELYEKAHKKFQNDIATRFMCDRYIQYQDPYKLQLVIAQTICEEHQLYCPFKVSADFLFDEEIFAEKSIDQNFEYLVVNSYGRSNQIKWCPSAHDVLFSDILQKLERKNKSFITTKKELNYPCTTDYHFSLVQIGQFSKNCKIILGVATSPFLVCLNKFSINSFEKLIIISNDRFTIDLDERFITIDSQSNPISSDENKGLW